MNINQIVRDGLYKTLVEFNKNDNNLNAIIQYCQLLEPQQQSFTRACNLIKFYRLPIIITFRNLYQKYKGVAAQSMKPEIKNTLEDIAAWVSSLLQKLQIEVFQQIKFIFYWGKAKKKYNIQVLPHQVLFGKYIAQLSKRREKIKQKMQKNDDVQQEIKQLQNFIINQDLLFLEKAFVQFIKQKVVVQVNEKMFLSKNKEKIKGQHQMQKKSVNTAFIENSPNLKKQEQLFKTAKQKSLGENRNEFDQKFGYEQLPYEQERNLPICCRSYFIQDQVIEQPENQTIEYKYYKYPFVDQSNQKISKIQKIKRTICGFLNNKGGTIYFGVKEHQQTKKREIFGYELTEKYKSQFQQDIFYFLEDILPVIQKNCVIKWVPIKNRNKNQFLPGRYIAKVIIQKGAKDQLYSYFHDKTQKFVFKTQNQFLIIKDSQKVLKFFRNKIQNPEAAVYRLHDKPCREPLRGKPVYKSQQNYAPRDIQSRQYACKQEANYRPQISTGKKTFVQKQSIRYLICGQSKEKFEIRMGKSKIKYKLLCQIQGKDLIIEIYRPQDVVSLKFEKPQIYQIYTWVQYQIEQQQQIEILNDIIAQMQKEYNCTISKKNKYVIDCQTQEISARFWIRVNEMGLKVFFVPASNTNK